MPEKELLYIISNDIGTITFNRPQARNALTFEMYDGLAEITDTIIAEPNQLKALIITGAGDKAFAAGTDISRFRDLNTSQDALDYERRMDRVLGSLESVPIPTIAAIRGACRRGSRNCRLLRSKSFYDRPKIRFSNRAHTRQLFIGW